MERSNEIAELASALSLAQASMDGATKEVKNEFFKSKYADLSACWEACRDPLTKNGLSIAQFPSLEPGAVSLLTVLMHKSGQFMSSSLTIPVSKQDAQGVGSAITYARRYALCAIVGISPEDDDGNAAVGHRTGKDDVPVKSLQDYPQETFDANMQKWDLSIRAGKLTHEKLIAMISTKGVLSPQQTQRILELGREPGSDDGEPA